MRTAADQRAAVRGAQATDPGAETPRRPRSFDLRDLGILAGSALSALFLVWIVYEQLLPLSGVLGFWICWLAAFVTIYWLAIRETQDRLAANDRAMSVGFTGAALLLAAALVTIIAYVVYKGIPGLRWHFFTQTQQFVGPLASGTAGGAAQAIVGTLEQVLLAIIIVVPLSIACAVFITEIGGPLSKPVRIFVDAMSGVPTIVAGLFIFATWVLGVQHGKFSGFAATLAISVTMLPTVTRTSLEVLKLVPDGLREASLALGAPEWRTTLKVVLPTARSGLVTAVILGVARAVGETAPLILTAFGNNLMNANPFHGPQDALPLMIFNQVRSSQPSQIERAWTGALVLIALVLVLFIIARVIGSGKLRRRGGPAAGFDSAADASAESGAID